MTAWPYTLTDGNQFTLAKLDPDTAPDIQVKTWSNVFGGGGTVSVDASVPRTLKNGTSYTDRITLASIIIEEDGSVREERAHLQDLVDDWNEDAAGNWRSLIEASRAKVLAYTQKQAEDASAALARMAGGDWS
jgi:hypothetical protein